MPKEMELNDDQNNFYMPIRILIAHEMATKRERSLVRL